MAKQPYIPLYIGDWEQDTNMLSLEAEGGWLKIIFKMFKDNKSGIYKTSTKALQNLWRKSPAEIQEIIKELLDANVCIIDSCDDGYVFTNRRMKKASEISNIRSKAVQKRYKTDTNTLQPLEYEYEYNKSSNDLSKVNTGIQEDSNSSKKGKFSQKPLSSDFNGLSDMDVGKAKEYLSITKRVDLSDQDIQGLWEGFKHKHLDGVNFYQDERKVFKHFFESLKYEKFDHNGTHKQSPVTGKSSAKQGTSEARIQKAKDW